MIPVNEPLITRRELKYAIRAIKSGWISSSGVYIKEFEEKFAKYIGRRYGIAVNNGTNALILALRSLNLPKGSEVILPTFTIISCALACVYNDLVPVFVDCEHDTLNIDTNLIESKISKKTRVIMPVHIYGHPVNMDKIMDIANKYNIYVVEDAAEAIGSEYKGSKCGSFGIISCFSFYANKVITTGEGGICLTDNEDIAEKMRSLMNLSFIKEKRFLHYDLGYNFRITNIQAAIGLAQLERVEDHISRKIWIGRKYIEFLKDLKCIKLPVEKEWAKNTYWMFGVLLDRKVGINAETLSRYLINYDIETRPFFYPLHLQPAFKKFRWYRKEYMPISEYISEYGLYLPSGLTITEKEIFKICLALKNIIRNNL